MRWLPLLLFVLFFLLALVGRSLVARRRTGINPIVWPNDDSVEGYIARAMHAATAALLIGLALHGAGWSLRVGLLPWAGSAPLYWAGVVLFGIALVYVLVAQWQMGASWRIGIDHARATSLVSHGLYAWSRNPIFLGTRLALLSALLMVPTAITLAATLALEVLIQLQVRLEEQHLLRLHGEGFRAYCDRVRRWFGRRLEQ
jgi:protein-S-isoprenylcysteine O-methyltransferase Ste14